MLEVVALPEYFFLYFKFEIRKMKINLDRLFCLKDLIFSLSFYHIRFLENSKILAFILSDSAARNFSYVWIKNQGHEITQIFNRYFRLGWLYENTVFSILMYHSNRCYQILLLENRNIFKSTLFFISQYLLSTSSFPNMILFINIKIVAYILSDSVGLKILI